MNRSYAASSSRQSAVFTAIVGLHFLAFLVIAAGLGPRIFEKAKDPPPIVWDEPPEPEPRVVEPDPTQPVDPRSGGVIEPDIELPQWPPPEVRQETAQETGEAAGSGAGIEIVPVEYVPPQRRTQDKRLAALINACYPAGARRSGEEGRVVARITIGADGRPTAWNVAQSSGFARLDQAIGCVVSRMEFIAGRENGRAVAADASLPITFQLD